MKQIIPDALYRHNDRRMLSPQDPSFFPAKDIVAILDAMANIVYLNRTYQSDERLFRRALFMEEPVLRLPPKYQPPASRHWDGYLD